MCESSAALCRRCGAQTIFFSWINANLNSFKCLLVNVSMDLVKHNRARAKLNLDFVKTFNAIPFQRKAIGRKNVNKFEASQLVHCGRSKENFAFLLDCDDTKRQTQSHCYWWWLSSQNSFVESQDIPYLIDLVASLCSWRMWRTSWVIHLCN